MYRRPKFLEILIEIRQEMSREVDYDVDLFAEIIRNKSGKSRNEKDKADEEFWLQNDESLFKENDKLKSLGFES